MRFGFLIAARCNAACTHCTTNSGPDKSAALPDGKILSLMEEAADIWERERAPGETLQFCISGGEPFLNFPRLLGSVAHGSRLGAVLTCVTNGFWASSDERARARLAPLKQAGLSMLAVSTSQFHQRYIRVERVQRALDIAKEVGMKTALKCALTASEQKQSGGLAQWAKSRDVDRLEVFPVMPYVREGAMLPEAEYVRAEGLPEGRCPATMLTVREDGTAYTCCMPGAFTDFHALGNVFETGLDQIYDRFYLNGTQQTLRHRGPIHFAQAIVAAGQGDRLRKSYAGVCDLCAHIASDPCLAEIAERSAQKFARAQFRAAIRKLGLRALRRYFGLTHGHGNSQQKGA